MGHRAGYDAVPYTPAKRSSPEREALETEFSERFADGMRNRMIVSRFKYGLLADAYPENLDAIGSLERRLGRYKETGNAEWLIDVANFAMIEFMHPAAPGAHFRPTDSHESPGRERNDGTADALPNLPPDLAVDRLRVRAAREGD